MGKSFYGGMDGRPFILKKIYQTIPEMIDRNKYKTDLNYGEYALISNKNRNHPDNGKLFKRVYASTGENIDAFIYDNKNHQFKNVTYENVEMKYIGAIVGPQGSAVEFKILGENLDINNIKDEYKDLEMIQTISDLTPKTEAGTSTSAIKMNTYSFRDKNGNKSTVYLDMTIPYNVIEWTTTQLNSQAKVSISENIEPSPFYQSYNLGIPKGQDGTSFNNIRIITPTAADNVVTISFDENRNITATKYEGLQDDIDKKRAIWVADVIDYKVDDKGTKYLVYLGDYNIVNNVILKQDGTFTIGHSHTGNVDQQEKLKWVNGVSLSQDGTLTKTDNQNVSVNQEEKLKWLKNVSLSQDGTFTKTDNQNVSVNQEEKLKWLKNVSLSQDGTFTKTDNQNVSVNQEEKLKWPVNIKLNPEDGTVTTTYNDNSVNTIQNPQMDWIKSATLNNDKLLQIDYVNADDISVNLKTPNQIELTKSGEFYATYNTGDRVLLGSIGELNPISTTAIAEGEEEPANLMAGGLLFITQDAVTEG